MQWRPVLVVISPLSDYILCEVRAVLLRADCLSYCSEPAVMHSTGHSWSLLHRWIAPFAVTVVKCFHFCPMSVSSVECDIFVSGGPVMSAQLMHDLISKRPETH